MFERDLLHLLLVKIFRNSDLFTKNFNKDTYKRHVVKFIGKIYG
jgi:hypothetical protein